MRTGAENEFSAAVRFLQLLISGTEPATCPAEFVGAMALGGVAGTTAGAAGGILIGGWNPGGGTGVVLPGAPGGMLLICGNVVDIGACITGCGYDN